jgi:hypothetical protein
MRKMIYRYINISNKNNHIVTNDVNIEINKYSTKERVGDDKN